MRSQHLRLFAALFVGLILMLTLALPWTRGADARVADFAPTLSDEAAGARVAAAQQAAARVGSSVALSVVSFPQTGYGLSNRHGFLDFWRSKGQMLLFGYPISAEFEEQGRIVQYFERARLEYHAEHAGTPYAVQLGLLGRELTQGRVFEAAAPMKGARYFPETQHNLYAKFLRYWEKRGGLARFGYPISEEIDELEADGVVRRVQYFERARFSWHPENMDAFYRNAEARNDILLATLYEVQLSDLGRQALALRAPGEAAREALSSAPAWSPELWPRRIEVDISQQWLYAYEGELLVYDAPVATGRNGFNTPTGSYAVYDKLRLQTMNGAAGGERWSVPKVPWVMYIVGGVAIHGTYWHNKFGTGYRPSHGCINVGMDDAQWLYEWAGVGTPVTIRR
jgi:hypothetical protein